MNNVDKKYVILGSLCALVLMLAVGYAAFNAVLNIKGTTNISSSWDVKITNVTEKNKVGSATTKDKSEGQDKTLCKNNLCNPTWDGLTASFEVDLVAPGDSIEYDITISNEGDLNAKLDNIVVSDPDNEYITFETSGLAINDTLDKKTSKKLTVKVTYKDVTIESSKPSSSNLTVTLDFSQVDGSGSEQPVIPENQIVYSVNESYISNGIALEDIPYYTSDYNDTNNSIRGCNVFLKHNIKNGNLETSDVCLKGDGTLTCFKYGDIAELKTDIANYFGADNCADEYKMGWRCSNSYASAYIPEDNSSFEIFSGEFSCSANAGGANCHDYQEVPL